MFGLTTNQTLAICSGACSFLAGSTAQLATLLGQHGAAYAVSAITLTGGILSIILAVTSGQKATVQQVAAMPGVDRITVNATANSTLASVATDPSQPKIGATSPETRAVLQETAKNA